MIIFLSFVALAVLVTAYVVAIRPWMRKQERFKPYFELVEPIEMHLWRKSETLLFARFKMLTGLILTILSAAGAIDLTPLMPLVPDKYEPFLKMVWQFLPLLIVAVGWIDERLRKDTTKPLELVAVPENAAPEVKEAVAIAEQTTAVASAEVKTLRDEGKLAA